MCERDCEHLTEMNGVVFNFCPSCGEYLGLDPIEEKGFYSFQVGRA